MQKPTCNLSKRNGYFILLVLLCCFLTAQSICDAAPLARITVEAGDYTRIDTPVAAELDGVPVGFPSDDIRLVEVKGSRHIDVPIQFEAGSPPKLWWVLSGKTEAGDKRTYELIRGGRTVRDSVRAKRDDKVLQIVKDGTKVLSYNHVIVPPPPIDARTDAAPEIPVPDSAGSSPPDTAPGTDRTRRSTHPLRRRSGRP